MSKGIIHISDQYPTIDYIDFNEDGFLEFHSLTLPSATARQHSDINRSYMLHKPELQSLLASYMPCMPKSMNEKRNRDRWSTRSTYAKHKAQ